MHNSIRLVAVFLEHKRLFTAFIAKRLMRTEDVEDVLQETYLSLEQIDSKKEIKSPKAYIFGVARNIISAEISRQAKYRAEQLDEASHSTIESSVDNPHRSLYNKERLFVLRRATEKLPPQCRRVFLMRKVNGLSHKQISAELGISKSTVERHITLAMTRLTAAMSRCEEPAKTASEREIEFARQRG